MERYRELVSDYDAFAESLKQPLARVVWRNPLRPGLPEDWGSMQSPEWTPLAWTSNAWKVPTRTPVGTWKEHKLGWLHVQEEVTLWPADALGAQPGERILDLCAAPGNKTVRIAAAMNNEGFLLANELKWKRVTSLRYHLSRLGVTCAAVSVGDGRELGGADGGFDRAMLDVPCSGEGMARKYGGDGWILPDGKRQALVGVQKGLLRNAVRLVRSGGVILYATCTFAPEENEGVVDWALRHLPVEVMELPQWEGLIAAQGCTGWRGTQYSAELIETGRFWPHLHDTGGFFVAKLRRI